jgi:hypothetical protein
MKLQFERTARAICVVLTEPGECDRIVEVACASDAFGAFALDVDPSAFKPLDALFALPRVVCVEIEKYGDLRGGDRWRVEVAYWHKALGTLTQYETEAASPDVALRRALTDI